MGPIWPSAVLVITVLLSACGAPAPQRLTAADDGGMVTLDVGQTLEVMLEANPSTGFSWALEAWDDDVVTPMGEPDFTPGGEADAVGVGGTVVWRFEAVASGRSAVELAYARPWEDVAPEQTFRFVVEVR